MGLGVGSEGPVGTQERLDPQVCVCRWRMEMRPRRTFVV